MASENKQNSTQSVPGFPGGRGGRGFGVPRGMMPVVKPQNLRGTIMRLWGYFGKEKKLFFMIFLLVIIDTFIGLGVPCLIGKAVDSLSGGRQMVHFGRLEIIVLVLFVAYVADAAINLMQGWVLAGASQRIVMNLRHMLLCKLQKLPVSFFDLRTHGEIMSRLTNDIENISGTMSQAATQLMSSSIMIAGSFVFMLLLSPLLTLASMVTIPLVFILTRSVTKKTGELFKKQQQVLGKLNGHIEETISGINVVKAFNQEEKIINEFDKVNEVLFSVGLKAQIWSGFLMPVMNVINNLGFAAVAGVGGFLAVKDMISVGVIASFLIFSRQFVRPLNDLANIYNSLQSAVAGAERVFEIFDEMEEIKDTEDAETLANPRGNVIFDDVTFGYRDDVNVLRNVSFEVRGGESIALVGPTGAGKTTIVNLLARFYDVTGGRVMIDGRDIREYTRDSLRRCFGIVLQDTYLFSGTIKDNIRYGCLEATDEEIKNAAMMANAHVFIERLPNGYDTMLTESGSNLSQGQRQLLTIARAILSNPSILILDEATSSVDTLTELKIQEAMLKLMKGRTSFIIAHRLSTIRDADLIMVIEDGTVKEKGNHDELMGIKGAYYNLYCSQYKNLVEN